MKLILIGLALLPLAFTQHGDQRWDSERNYGRSLHAEKNQIANMNYIKYDASLDKILKDEVEKYGGEECPPPTVVRKGNLEIFVNPLSPQSEVMLIPGRSRYATYQKECKYGREGHSKWFFNVVADVATTELVHGTPGSKCPTGRKPHERYPFLCLLPSDLPSTRVRRDTEDLKDTILKRFEGKSREELQQFIHHQYEEIREMEELAEKSIQVLDDDIAKQVDFREAYVKVIESTKNDFYRWIQRAEKALEKLDEPEMSEASQNPDSKKYARKIAAPKFWEGDAYDRRPWPLRDILVSLDSKKH